MTNKDKQQRDVQANAADTMDEIVDLRHNV